MLIIDRYAYTNKLSHSNPYVKFVIVVIALAIATITKNNYVNLAIFMVMLFLATVIAGISLSKYLRILAIPMAFLFLSILPVLIHLFNEDIFVLSIRVFNRYIGVTRESISRSILLATRVLGSISATFFLALTTPLNELIKILKKLHIPNTIIELMVLIYRTIFIFLEEAKVIYIGQEIRFGYSGFKKSLNSISLLVRSLFLGVLLKHKDMADCLDLRLYDGEFRIGG